MDRQLCFRLMRYGYNENAPSDVMLVEIDSEGRATRLAMAYTYNRGTCLEISLVWEGMPTSPMSVWKRYASLDDMTHEMYIRALLGEFDTGEIFYLDPKDLRFWQRAKASDRALMFNDRKVAKEDKR